MTDRCVLAGYTVDEQVARLTGVGVFFGALAFLALPSPYLAALLVVDFVPRALGKPQFSLLARAGRRIAGWLQLPASPVDAGPKQFAARLGLGMTAAMVVFSATGLGSVAVVLGGVLAVCAALEGFVGFCVGCTMYSLVMRARERLLGHSLGA